MTPKTIRLLKSLNKLRKAGSMAMSHKDKKAIKEMPSKMAGEILYKQYNHLINPNDNWD